MDFELLNEELDAENFLMSSKEIEIVDERDLKYILKLKPNERSLT